MGMPELPPKVKLAIACSGIFFSFSYFAVLQEDVYKKPYNGEYFAYTFLALVCERGVNAAIGLAGVMCLGGSGLKIPLMDIFNSGVSQMFAMAGSNEALRYVSYPTQVLGKSCKMVPVMAGGIILGGKKYGFFEYLQVVIITGGVVAFNLGKGKAKSGAADSAYGLGLIGFSLVMDAVTGGLQDKVKKRTIELNPETSKKPVRRRAHAYTATTPPRSSPHETRGLLVHEPERRARHDAAAQPCVSSRRALFSRRCRRCTRACFGRTRRASSWLASSASSPGRRRLASPSACATRRCATPWPHCTPPHLRAMPCLTIFASASGAVLPSPPHLTTSPSPPSPPARLWQVLNAIMVYSLASAVGQVLLPLPDPPPRAYTPLMVAPRGLHVLLPLLSGRTSSTTPSLSLGRSSSPPSPPRARCPPPKHDRS